MCPVRSVTYVLRPLIGNEQLHRTDETHVSEVFDFNLDWTPDANPATGDSLANSAGAIGRRISVFCTAGSTRAEAGGTENPN